MKGGGERGVIKGGGRESTYKKDWHTQVHIRKTGILKLGRWKRGEKEEEEEKKGGVKNKDCMFRCGVRESPWLQLLRTSLHLLRTSLHTTL